MSTVVLLGPQRLRPTLVSAVERLEIDGPIAAITAGWQEREHEVDELSEHLGQPVVNLALYRRTEKVFLQDEELFEAHRARQNALRQLQELYRLRLDRYMASARRLLAHQGPPDLVDPERESAIAALSALDAHHLGRIEGIHSEFWRRLKPPKRPVVAHHRAEIEGILDRCAAVAIAGGHVAILVNRLRLFGLADLLRDRTVFAWSAGAMALADRIVLFHDSPPQGPGNAELLDRGLSLFPGLVPFPHARRRLRLEDPVRVQLLARRFAPSVCVALDDGAQVWFENGEYSGGGGVGAFTLDGSLEGFAAA